MRVMRSGIALKLLGALVAALGLLLVGAGCNEDDVEEVLGQASAASVESAYDVTGDPLMNEWITHVGNCVVSHSRRQSIPYEFKVVDTRMVNAFAAPYGHIYVTQGFLDFAETEDEVWVVMAHEVGHVVARDSIHSLKRSLLWGLVVQLISGESRTAGDIAGIGLGLLSLRYSRVDEYEADDSGTMLAYRAGYDPHAGVTFFKRLMTDIEKRRPASWEVYFMTHPPTERRIRRQLERAELDESNPEALMQIGRGYLLRGQPGRATHYLLKATEVAPESATAQSLLGDAYAARGQMSLARMHYAKAEDAYARRRLAMLQGVAAPRLAGIGEAGRSEAGELLARVGEVGALVVQTRANAKAYTMKTGGQVAQLVSGVKRINERLVDLADTEADVSDAVEQLVGRGSTAISRAVESVYMLESVNRDLEEVGSRVEKLVAECESGLRAAQAGEGNPEDVPALREALAELRRATATLELAMAEAPRTFERVRSAQSAANDVTNLMEMVVCRDDPDSALNGQLRDASTHTQDLAIEALHAVARAQRQSVKARGHALVARLNLLGTAATPQMQALYDRQVAHFLLVPEAAVRAARAVGGGYGEAAMSIAAARSLGTDPGHFLPTVAGVSPVGAAMEQGAAISSANVLLKFLAGAMQSEREATPTT